MPAGFLLMAARCPGEEPAVAVAAALLLLPGLDLAAKNHFWDDDRGGYGAALGCFVDGAGMTFLALAFYGGPEHSGPAARLAARSLDGKRRWNSTGDRSPVSDADARTAISSGSWTQMCPREVGDLSARKTPSRRSPWLSWLDADR